MSLNQYPSYQRSSPPIEHGKLRIQIHSCYLNVPVKRPYVILTMGDQLYETSVSEYPQGRWHESFEFKVTFHAQLFDTVQLDLYDSYMLLPDKHVGRAEIRLKTLHGMPETFTSYYEIWDKRLSTGASSRVGRAKTMATNVGAIQAKISYIYQQDESHIDNDNAESSGDLADLANLSIRRRSSGGSSIGSHGVVGRRRGMTDEELATEFRQQVKHQRESAAIAFQKYEEHGNGNNMRRGSSDKESLPDGLDYPDESDGGEEEEKNTNGDLGVTPLKQPLALSRKRTSQSLREQSTPVNPTTKELPNNPTPLQAMSNWFGFGAAAAAEGKQQQPATSRSVRTTKAEMAETVNVLEEEDDGVKLFPLLSTIGSWTVNKETNQVLKAIGKLLAAFGQGFELSNIQILTGFSMLERFYMDLPRDRTWDVVEDLSEIELAAYFWKYSVASYGWKGLNFIGKGNGYFSDAMRDHSDVLSVVEYLSIPKEDVLAYEFRAAEAFRPSYFITRDRPTNSIVLCIRGTMSAFDTMTDLVCEYEPWRGGLVHKGMKSAATWFFRHVAPQLVAYSNEHSTNALYIVGHSLGAATASILTIMLLDFMDEFQKDKKEEFKLKCFGYAPACGLSLDLAEQYKEYIESIVFADDVVSKLSYGSMMDIKELIIASAEAAQNLGIGQLLWTDKPEGKQWEAAFERIAECRKRCLESMENPRLYVAGKVYQFWLDPAPHNDTRIVIERTDARRVSSEIIVRRSIVLDHLPTNFDLAFKRAREALMVGTGRTSTDSKQAGILDESGHEGFKEKIEEQGLKKTTQRTGGEGTTVPEGSSR
ncbi:hypothetical protein K492DRAFT_239349 [Lichtheimia hyalospora FSU 10163]|nr:hypothetical protein K492DRAFT_239349 [Lichtheimia hyalospora FSU 10163]